jgi:hypothetical protein
LTAIAGIPQKLPEMCQMLPPDEFPDASVDTVSASPCRAQVSSFDAALMDQAKIWFGHTQSASPSSLAIIPALPTSRGEKNVSGCTLATAHMHIHLHITF